MTTTLTAFQQQRRDTASNWQSNNPTLLAGELGYETDSKKFKIGDGATAYNSLDYLPIPDTNRLLAGDLTIGGSLTVNGTTTEISSQNLNIEDKNIILGKVSSPSDTTADGGGITLKAASDKTITWSDANDSWDFNQNINAASTYGYRINNVSVLNATTLGSSVVNSSLTSVGTIDSGVWQGTAIGSSYMTAGTTSAVGAVQLTDSVSSTSTTTAATPNSVKTAKDAADAAQSTANAALPKSGGQITGNITCSGSQTFDGRDLSVDGAKLDGIAAGATGNQTKSDIDALGVNAATFTVADESTDTSCSVLFSTSATGEQAAKSGSNFTFNSATGDVSATKFTGDLTGDVTGDVTGNVTGNVSGSSGSCTGNSATATALATARTISGASFDGTADITLNNSNITNGAGYITATLTNEQVQDIVGAMLSGNTETGITVTYDDTDGTIDFVVDSQSDNNLTNALLAILNGLSSSAGVLSNGVTATTQSAGDASTKVATTAYTDTAISNLVDSSPSALNTLNELAAALGDDANFSTTITNALAGKLATNGNGSSLTNLNASNISSGTIPAARVGDISGNAASADTLDVSNSSSNSTFYPTFVNNNGSGKTFYIDDGSGFTFNPSTNTLVAGTFSGTHSGNGSALTSINAATLDSIDSSQFVRSDANDTMNGNYTITGSGDEKLALDGLNPYIRFKEGGTEKAFIKWNSNGYFRLQNQEDGSILDLRDSIRFSSDGGSSYYSVWHGGNDGSGSGLDADKLDGVEGSNYMSKTGSYWNVTNWLQCTSSHGLYWPNNYGYHVYLTNQYLVIRNNQSSNGIRVETNSGTLRGMVYANNDNAIGFLDEGGNWSLRTNRSGNTTTLHDQHFVSDTNDTYDIGSSSARWKSVHAKYLHFGSSSRYFGPVGGSYGTVTVNGSGVNGWEGYSIDDRAVFMHDGNVTTGLFNDVNDEWLIHCTHNGKVTLYYNGGARAETSSSGFYVHGTITATSNITAYSDEKLKTNIKTIDNALDIVDQLRGVSFDWKESGEHSIGVIAQEVEEVLPEIVEEDHNEVKTVDYGKMVGVLINAIKELRAEVEELKGAK